MINIDILYGSKIFPAFAESHCVNAQVSGSWFGRKAITKNIELTIIIGNVAIIPSRIALK